MNPQLGQRLELPVTADAVPVFDTARSVQLLRYNARHGDVVKAYAITFDSMVPASKVTSGADPVCVTGRPLVSLAFGAAGLSRVVQFHYPTLGGVVVIHASDIDLTVRPTLAEAPEMTQRPTVGAWMAPAVANLSLAPMVLVDDDDLNTYTCPTFARYLCLVANNAGAALPAGQWRVRFIDAAAQQVAYYQPSDPTVRIPIPPWAMKVNVGHSTALHWCTSFEIGLS